jgi:hypothetical protein
MEQKKYVVGNKSLTQSELTLNDSKKVVGLLKNLDFDVVFKSKKSLYEIILDYLDQDVLEQLFDVILKGDKPKGVIGDWMTAGLAMEIIDDFFGLNAGLMKSALNLLNNFQSFQAESVKTQ